ncbi:hypothetical protein N9D61_03160 [Planktomarina sp.]|jgi:hypothetical protein|nr:hypothetical protein [Planktomarina sp.]
MAEFKLERFKYNWKGNWTTGIAYKRDDVVRVGGKSYVCVITHTSEPQFRTDLNAILAGSNPPQPAPKWKLMTSAKSFEGAWTTATNYNLGDLVLYNGSVWNCVVSHTSSNFYTDVDSWTIYAQTQSFVGNWTSSSTYSVGAVVRYSGNAWRCIVTHTAQAILEDDSDKWELYHQGLEFKGTWISGNEYRVNDLVKYGATIFRCTETHTAAELGLDDEKFVVETFGIQFDGTWSTDTYYNVGDLVRHGGFTYYAISNSQGSNPYNDGEKSSDWIILARNYRFTGSWNIQSAYQTGDITSRGGNLYLAVRDIGSGEQVDGSTQDYLQEDTWELLVPGKTFKGNWVEDFNYAIGDVVFLKGSAYTCNFGHYSDMINFPGDNGNAYLYWDLLIQAGQPSGLTTKGDLLTYGFSRAVDQDGSTVFDGSTLGDTRVPIGEAEQILSINNELEAYWRNIVEDAETFYVSPEGKDIETNGTFQKPFRTIRYAAEYVEDNITAGTPAIIRPTVGRYEEIGPIIVPAGCAVNGDELRSTTVIANPALPNYQNHYTYVLEYLDRFTNIAADIATGNLITPSTGNTLTQTTSILVPRPSPIDGVQATDPVTGELLFDETYPQATVAGVNAFLAKITDWKNYVEFSTQSGDVNPTITGSNTLNTDQGQTDAAKAFYINRLFIQEELYRFIKEQHPTVTFNEEQIKNDVWSLLRGIRRDITYSGNYGTITSARRYSNAVNGSSLDTIFMLRDSTGLRDMTTGGLKGVLNPPGVFDLYQKPTGGACVALDPGWGPDDERTWITSRSPYIQGVTNTGDGCVGQRIDGSLHNGGNRSMTSNDFTQVLSDGIGVWVSNNARAELVSVFTYYCQIGYFAEDGGIIRAANGNNSYGKWGSIADGYDQTEVPQEVLVFNRNNEAQVKEAFAGGASDELFAFEYSNAGESYTSASASVVGAGANANVQFTDFRHGGLFEARLTSPDGSSAGGGAGYINRQGSAQETLDATSTIKLSINDPTQQQSEILNMRIVITDGTGVGQYGYINTFDFSTKEVTVSRDSDGVAGWDHIIPGTPLVAAFDLTTRYKIEPRVMISAPASTVASYNLFTNRSYVDLAFGDTTATYSGVTGGANAIWRDDTLSYITVSSPISPTAVQFSAGLAINPVVPFNIRGRTSGTEATITNISANTGSVIEVDVNANGDNFVAGEEIDLVLQSGSGDTFDGAPIAATFNVLREGKSYTPTIDTGGQGYAPGDTITITGTQLGGATPTNDLYITVSTVSDDSTNSILTFTSTGEGINGVFVSLTNNEFSRYSTNGESWTETTLSFLGDYKRLISGNNRFIAIATDQDKVSSSLNGVTWSTVALPVAQGWVDGVYGNGKFVIIGNDTDLVATSTDGNTWATASIPNDDTGDSTIAQWTYAAYGKGKFVAISVNDRATATSGNASTWTRNDQALPDFTDPIVGVAYGQNRFVVITESGELGYSFDGITWIEGTSIGSDTYKTIKYDNGMFVVLLDGAENSCLVSEYGLLWTTQTLTNALQWSALASGIIGNDRKWVIKASAASTNAVSHLGVGARAKVRAEVSVGSLSILKILDPGSYYQTPPTVTITDPNNTTDAAIETRISNGVLAQPDFINRGAGYRSTTSTITITGDGFADIVPIAATITMSGVREIPGPGVQIEITGILDPLTEQADDLYTFSGVSVKDLGDDGTRNNTNLVEFTLSPNIGVENPVLHGTSATLRQNYSQCRISGHDFLDIGTGGFTATNYPTIYSGGAFFQASPENEVYEVNSGRVYYVSTDQDGNFRAGELFSVQQATGIVTISAQFFDLDGLSELALGGVRLGGSGTVVSEFSTDGTFSADSNNVIPTQRAIATFLADRLSVGGENLETNELRAGRITLGGADNVIQSATNQYIKIPVPVNINGTYQSNDGEGNITTETVGISGTIITQMLVLKTFEETMQ